MSTRRLVGRERVGDFTGLTALCPIRAGTPEGGDRSHATLIREALADLPDGTNSPFTSFANTYFARFYVLPDVFHVGRPARREHLKSQYLVFTSNFHGDAQTYLSDMWTAAADEWRPVWQHCVAFDDVHDDASFVSYIGRCRVKNALLFNGSTDEPLAAQLKGLYLKQEFGRFVERHQGLAAPELRAAFRAFVAEVAVDDLDAPTWPAGAEYLSQIPRAATAEGTPR